MTKTKTKTRATHTLTTADLAHATGGYLKTPILIEPNISTLLQSMDVTAQGITVNLK